MRKSTKALALLLALSMVTPVVAMAEEAPKKDTIVIAQSADPVSLDPYGTTDTPAIRVANCIFDTLVTLDDEGNIAPRLA